MKKFMNFTMFEKVKNRGDALQHWLLLAKAVFIAQYFFIVGNDRCEGGLFA